MAEYDKSTDLVFTSDGTPKVIDLAYLPRSVFMLNKTAFATQNANPGIVKRAYGYSTSANGTAYVVANTNAAATDTSRVITSGGFHFITRDTLSFGPVKTGTAISQADFAVVTINSHGYLTGDTVLLYNTTDMLQVAGAFYSVTVTGANTFTIPIESSGFAAAATAVSAKKVLYPDLYIPFGCVMTNVVQAASDATQAVVTTSVNHRFMKGQKVRFQIENFTGPAGSGAWGMVELNALEGDIVSIGNVDGAGTYTEVTDYITPTNAFQVDIDVSTFTAFVYPTSAEAVVGHDFPMVFSIGDTNFGYSGPTPPPHIGIPGAFVANTGYQLIIGVGPDANTVMHADGDVVEVHMEYPTQVLSL